MRLKTTTLLIILTLAFPIYGWTDTVLNRNFPVVEGKYQMTKEWTITLPTTFNRRIEDKQLVLWRPGITIWATVWNNDKNQSIGTRIRSIKKNISKEAYDIKESKRFLSYRLSEKAEDKRVPALYGLVFRGSGHAQVSIYFDSEESVEMATSILERINGE